MGTFLVTGGAGFIGSHLCEALLGAGHRVLVVDDLSTGRWENVAHLETHPRFELFVDTVCSRGLLADLIRPADGIFHLAAAVGVRLVVENPVHTVETNVLGTSVVLELASAAGKKVILASTSEVYGKSTKIPFSEDDDLVFGATRIGRWSYGCSKAVDEFLALAYARERQLQVTVARLFNTVGPRQSGLYGMVLPRFVQQALSSEPITVHGDGTQRRCFCYVGDVVRTLIDLMEHKDAAGGLFNVGSDEEVSITELAERVRRISGSSSTIVTIPYHEAWDEQFEDMPRRVPDLTRIRALTGFRPRVELNEIISRVIDYERSHRSSRSDERPMKDGIR
jgi:UDP-glucose 4-epimerase